MERFYDKNDKKTFSREAIIGLGEESFRKNYYPELQVLWKHQKFSYGSKGYLKKY